MPKCREHSECSTISDDGEVIGSSQYSGIEGDGQGGCCTIRGEALSEEASRMPADHGRSTSKVIVVGLSLSVIIC